MRAKRHTVEEISLSFKRILATVKPFVFRLTRKAFPPALNRA